MNKTLNNYFLQIINDWEKTYAALIIVYCVAFFYVPHVVTVGISHKYYSLYSPILLFIVLLDIFYLYDLYRSRNSIDELRYKSALLRLLLTYFFFLLFLIYYELRKIVEITEFIPIIGGMITFLIILTLIKRKVTNEEKS